MPRLEPTPRAIYSQQVVRFLFGSGNWIGVLWVLVALLLLSWFAESTYEIMTGEFLPHQLWMIPISSIGLGLLVWWARQAARPFEIQVEQFDEPKRGTALILFLSPPGADKQRLTQSEDVNGLQSRILDPPTRQTFKGAWRMPIEAIAYHLERLEYIIILPSRDSPPKENEAHPEDGTFRHLDLFKWTVYLLMSGTATQPRLIGLEEIDPALATGVDFEDARALVAALHETFEWLHERNISDNEIVVDITGGQKVTTVAGAVVALGEDRHFQYVSTRDYKVRTYDLTYQAIE